MTNLFPDSYTAVERGVADLYPQRGHTTRNTHFSLVVRLFPYRAFLGGKA